MRVELRDAEWRIRRMDASSGGGHVLSCKGLSGLVQGREGLFLTQLEQPRILDPRTITLVDDISSNNDASLLYIDSPRRQRLPLDKSLRMGHRAAFDQLDYQLEPALQALSQPHQRIRLANGVDLGKALFPDGLSYASAALPWLHGQGEELNASVEDGHFAITARPGLRQRLGLLPPKARPEHDRFVLTPDAARVNDAGRASRLSDDAAWPDVPYPGPLHPVMQWLADRALHAFGRHTAAVLRLPGQLGAQEHSVRLHDGFPNQRGRVLIQDWIGVPLSGNTSQRQLLGWDEMVSRLQLKARSLPNRVLGGSTRFLARLLSAAVSAAMSHLKIARAEYEAAHQEQLATRQQQLQIRRQHQQQQLNLQFEQSGQPEAIQSHRRTAAQHNLDRIFNHYQYWLNDTQATGREPCVQMVAAFTGQAA